MLNNGWYHDYVDRNHLSRTGYLALSAKQLAELLRPECIADFNADGGIDGGDVQSFFAAWEAGDALSDVNADGGIDGADVGTFFARWESGAC